MDISYEFRNSKQCSLIVLCSSNILFWTKILRCLENLHSGLFVKSLLKMYKDRGNILKHFFSFQLSDKLAYNILHRSRYEPKYLNQAMACQPAYYLLLSTMIIFYRSQHTCLMEKVTFLYYRICQNLFEFTLGICRNLFLMNNGIYLSSSSLTVNLHFFPSI